MSEEIPVPEDAFVEVDEGPEQGEIFDLSGKTMTIGRAPICDIRLSDPYVSKKHCQIVFRRDHFTVIDLNSMNKTRVNGTVYLQKNLRNGDFISIGKTVLKFMWENLDESVLDELEDVLGTDDQDDAEVLSEEGDSLE
jgi:pSer/pThr/pTyr-binding forkhead associated (FHA) protein